MALSGESPLTRALVQGIQGFQQTFIPGIQAQLEREAQRDIRSQLMRQEAGIQAEQFQQQTRFESKQFQERLQLRGMLEMEERKRIQAEEEDRQRQEFEATQEFLRIRRKSPETPASQIIEGLPPNLQAPFSRSAIGQEVIRGELEPPPETPQAPPEPALPPATRVKVEQEVGELESQLAVLNRFSEMFRQPGHEVRPVPDDVLRLLFPGQPVSSFPEEPTLETVGSDVFQRAIERIGKQIGISRQALQRGAARIPTSQGAAPQAPQASPELTDEERAFFEFSGALEQESVPAAGQE